MPVVVVSGSDGYWWWLWLTVTFSYGGNLQLVGDGQEVWVMALMIITVSDWW
jgi:hypothetical protein